MDGVILNLNQLMSSTACHSVLLWLLYPCAQRFSHENIPRSKAQMSFSKAPRGYSSLWQKGSGVVFQRITGYRTRSSRGQNLVTQISSKVDKMPSNIGSLLFSFLPEMKTWHRYPNWLGPPTSWGFLGRRLNQSISPSRWTTVRGRAITQLLQETFSAGCSFAFDNALEYYSDDPLEKNTFLFISSSKFGLWYFNP